MAKFLKKIFGDYSQKEIKRVIPIVDKIESLEKEISPLTDDELKDKTKQFKDRLKNGETLDDILPEAYAVVRESSVRVLGMKHYKVQIIGGIILHQGRIAEMKTGEGKTLAATLPVYLNALSGKGVHVVTVNDYLAKRDSEWMGKVYSFLGLSTGLIIHGLDNEQRRKSYECDITYGTNNEFGFDYLRDNMVIYKKNMVQRGHNYAIVDEVDSILVDEARTPLIISGAGDKSTDLYKLADTFARGLKAKVFATVDDKEETVNSDADYIVDEKASTATLTEKGTKKAEDFFKLDNLSDPQNMTISHHINQSLKARSLMKKDSQYIVKEGQVLIVDEFTGRLMYGRRYSNGLHQAIEAKEGVQVARESKTLATITFQNYFRMYKKLSGMTGTARTEEEEFRSIYSMDVIAIPTNEPVIRQDNPDVVYKNEKGKFKAVANDIARVHEKQQPVLIGTITVEKSEMLSKMLKKMGIPHQVLNAKYHEKEAEIVAQAGKAGAVTIATNMAGRGTDIVLGGNPEYLARQQMKKSGYEEEIINQSISYNETDDEQILSARKTFRELNEKYKNELVKEREKVLKAGGLYIVGTERHESRRIDNQLRGRSGRQGDPGESRFYISLEDDLMRLFGQDRLGNIVGVLGLSEDDAIEHRMLSNAIETAQKRVEGRNFNIRKRVLEYDDVMNKQREVIYSQRQKVLEGESLKGNFENMIKSLAESMINAYCSESPYPDYWDWESIKGFIKIFGLDEETVNYSDQEKEDLKKQDLIYKIQEEALKVYDEKEKEIGSERIREIERVILLRTVDEKWMDHIDAMDQLRRGIGLRAYGQKDPVVEYRMEGFDMFEEMTRSIQHDAVAKLLNLKISKEKTIERKKVAAPVNAVHGDIPRQKTASRSKTVGRNDPCPCGSGKKYKKCCGA